MPGAYTDPYNTSIKISDWTDQTMPQNKKRPITFISGNWALLISSILKFLPIKDTLSLYRNYLNVGLIFFILFNPTQAKSQQ